VLGTSAEFTEYRAYRQGDDPGRIDWKLLARSNRAFIRLSNDRTVLPTTLVVDASASLAYPSATLEKWHHARLVTLGLAAAAHRGGDPVGLLVGTAAGPRQLPHRTRRGVVHDVARTLADVVPAGSPPLAPLLGTIRTRGRVAIISDFLGDADALLKVAAPVAASGREIYAVHVIHAAELNPSRQALLVTDPEQHDLRRPLSEETRHDYLEAFGAWRAELARSWRAAGAVYTEVVTSEPVAHAVRRIVVPAAATAGTVR
jgi:uncharacterized protein (DUF58 family)